MPIEPFIVVPISVAEDLGIDLKSIFKSGNYYIDTKNKYEVCLLDLHDNPVICLECDLYIERELNRILIPMEFMSVADITISTGKGCWKVEGKTGWIKNVLEVEDVLMKESKSILKYTPIHDLEEEFLEEENSK